jgi:hypothetical protein
LASIMVAAAVGWLAGSRGAMVGWIVGASLVGVLCFGIVLLQWGLTGLAEAATCLLAFNFIFSISLYLRHRSAKRTAAQFENAKAR